MPVQAEQRAVEALRERLLDALPAKVDALNATRAAVLKAARRGAYAIPPGAVLTLGAVGSEVAVPLTEGLRSAGELVDDIVAAALPGITASSDPEGRLVLTAGGPPSSASVGPGEVNAVFGWPIGGCSVVRAPLAAPDWTGVCDGDPGFYDLGAGFWVVIGRRSSTPRANIRSGIHIVAVEVEVFAAEPNSNIQAAPEYIGSCVRAVREVLLEDRTLGGRVHLTEVSRVEPEPSTFRFRAPEGVSPLMTRGTLSLRIHVFERS